MALHLRTLPIPQALDLHAKGLFHVRREKGVSSLEELAETIEDPTIAKEFRSKSRET